LVYHRITVVHFFVRLGVSGKECKVPSSENRRRLEVPRRLYEGLKQVAVSEDRSVTSVVTDLLSLTLPNYCPPWDPDGHLAARLDRHARRALTLAHEEAHGYSHNYIGTEHVLIGMIQEGEGGAARALSSLGVNLREARGVVETIVGRVAYPAEGEVPPPGWMPYTPRVRKVIGLAVDESRRLGHDHVGTEHLLLGIIREGEGVANVILEKAGALDKVARVRTLALLNRQETDDRNAENQD
jgi:ATP-dependent Clp protease ATP-binding subunit ClpC